MATTVKYLSRQARQLSKQTQGPTLRHWHATSPASPFRAFSSNGIRRAEGDSSETPTDASESSSDSAPYFNEKLFKQLDRDDKAKYHALTSEERRKADQVKQALDEEFADKSKNDRALDRSITQYSEDLDREFPDEPEEWERPRRGFFNMNETEDTGGDESFQGDDITSDAHRELEQVREIREYARLAGWEMPLLAST